MMEWHNQYANPVAYGIVLVGGLIAIIAALAPLPTGAFRLSWVFLLLGIGPYLVFLCLTAYLPPRILLGAGGALLICDLIARLGAGITNDSQAGAAPAVYLWLILTVLVLAVGLLPGRFYPQLRA